MESIGPNGNLRMRRMMYPYILRMLEGTFLLGAAHMKELTKDSVTHSPLLPWLGLEMSPLLLHYCQMQFFFCNMVVNSSPVTAHLLMSYFCIFASHSVVLLILNDLQKALA